MKSILLTAVLAISTLSGWAQSTEKRTVKEFSQIDVQQGIEVIITHGENQFVTLEASSPEHLKEIKTQNKGKTLKIYMKQSKKDYLKASKVKVYISNSSISLIRVASGASVVAVTEINTPEIYIDLDSGASFNGQVNSNKCVVSSGSGSSFKGRVITGNFICDISGGASVKLIGKSENSVINCNGGSLIAGNFKSEKASVKAKNTSSVLIGITNSIYAMSDYSSAIKYNGNPAEVSLEENTYMVLRK